MTNPLDHPDTLHLQAAEGWLELGNATEAFEELEKIDHLRRAHPDVLEIRWQIYARENKWDLCIGIARALTKLTPKRAFGWIHLSFALHELKRTQEAMQNIESVADLFPKDILMRYNMACYECQLRHLDKAELWLSKAFDLAEDQGTLDHYRLMALDDSDLEPLWNRISEIGETLSQ